MVHPWNGVKQYRSYQSYIPKCRAFSQRIPMLPWWTMEQESQLPWCRCAVWPESITWSLLLISPSLLFPYTSRWTMNMLKMPSAGKTLDPIINSWGQYKPMHQDHLGLWAPPRTCQASSRIRLNICQDLNNIWCLWSDTAQFLILDGSLEERTFSSHVSLADAIKHENPVLLMSVL